MKSCPENATYKRYGKDQRQDHDDDAEYGKHNADGNPEEWQQHIDG